MIFWSRNLTGAYGRRRCSGGILLWEQTMPSEGHLVGYRPDGQIHPMIGGVILPGPCEATTAPETLTDENENTEG